MPRETATATIDGEQYTVTKFGGKTGSDIIIRLGLAGLHMSLTLAQLAAVANGIGPHDLAWLRDLFAEQTRVGVIDKDGDGRVNFVPLAGVFDDHFSGRWGAMTRWFAFAFETNFASFLAELPDLGRELRARFASISPKTATGSAGGSSSPRG